MSIGKIVAAVLLFNMAAAGQGRRSIPNATPEQTAAIANITATLALPMQRLAAARLDLVAAALADPRDDAAIRGHVKAIGAAELELVKARAVALAELQSSVNRLSTDQITAFAAVEGNGGSGGYRTSMPHVTPRQASALLDLASL